VAVGNVGFDRVGSEKAERGARGGGLKGYYGYGAVRWAKLMRYAVREVSWPS
jgi:hypothetical protein